MIKRKTNTPIDTIALFCTHFAVARSVHAAIWVTTLAAMALYAAVGCKNKDKGIPSFTKIKPGEDLVAPVAAPADSYAEALEKVVSNGQLDCTHYAELTAASPDDLWNYKLGPSSAYFPDSPSALGHVATGPQNGEYCHGDCQGKPVDWSGKAGQTLYLANGDAGMDRTRFVWSRHEGHGGAEYSHLYLLSPINASVEDDHDSWFTASPDPALSQEAWLTNGVLTTPTAIGRGTILWGNHALIGFSNGLVGAVGSGNSGDTYPSVVLEGRTPMAIAITPNNELAFVATWNGTTCEGELAVIALRSRDGFPYMLPNHGFFDSLTLLGYVPLPVATPTALAATVDHAQWNWIQSTDLSDPTERQQWIDRATDHQTAQAGYVVVSSRDEEKVVWVDISPTLRWAASMYFGSDTDFELTQGDDWPLNFDAAPEAVPVVVHTETVTRPTVVAAGFDVGDRGYLGSDALFSRYSYVATLDGELHTFDSTGLMSGAGTAPSLFETHPLCNNPTHVSYGTGMPHRDELLFTCRGDRRVIALGPDGALLRSLADDRVSDPVAAMILDTRSASVLAVADYANDRILNYQNGPLRPWGDDVFSNQPEDDGFLFLGLLELDGAPVAMSASAVP